MAKKATSSSSTGEVFDIERVRQLIELMKENELSEVDLQQGEQRIKLRRGGDQPLAPAYAAAPIAHAPVAQAPAAGTSAAPASDGGAGDSGANDNAVTIESPMVGTFYSKPNPDSPPYVKVGDMVSADTVVCTIEAMKTFNEIPAGVAGKVVAVLVKNEEPVDVNKPLFKVEAG